MPIYLLVLCRSRCFLCTLSCCKHYPLAGRVCRKDICWRILVYMCRQVLAGSIKRSPFEKIFSNLVKKKKPNLSKLVVYSEILITLWFSKGQTLWAILKGNKYLLRNMSSLIFAEIMSIILYDVMGWNI